MDYKTYSIIAWILSLQVESFFGKKFPDRHVLKKNDRCYDSVRRRENKDED